MEVLLSEANKISIDFCKSYEISIVLAEFIYARMQFFPFTVQEQNSGIK